jgi:hypothetical protein
MLPRMLLALVIASAQPSGGHALHVGPSQRFARPEEALVAAQPGDTILIHPRLRGAPYERVALRVTVPDLTIRTVLENPDEPVVFSGEGFDYSGTGSVPRAIVQFDPTAKGSTLEGFELRGARNGSRNGSGVRINQADHITIRGCTIHDNDMGIMSNGSLQTGADQRIDSCLIHHNGAPTEPGYSHNLYLGGCSVVLSACEVYASTAGHNVKSRAHYTRVEYCFIHDSANRELDLVDDAGVTDVPGSDVVLLGNIIVKATEMTGNRGVIHFGQDGGHGHSGVLYAVNNTIVSPYVSPIVSLSAPRTSLNFGNNIVWDGGRPRHGQVLVEFTGDAGDRLRGRANIASIGFGAPSWAGIIDRGAEPIQIMNPAVGDYRWLNQPASLHGRGIAINSIGLPRAPGPENDRPGEPFFQYQLGPKLSPRSDAASPDLGAFMNNQ